MKARCLAFLLPLFLCACAMQFSAASAVAQEPAPIGPLPRSEVDDLLAYHQLMQSLPRAELQKEFDRLLVEQPGAGTTVRKAMVLALLGRKGDLAQAQAQLQSLLNDDSPNARALKPLARLLATNYAATQKLAEQQEKTDRQLADYQSRIDHLNKMLNELKAIERALPARLGGGS